MRRLNSWVFGSTYVFIAPSRDRHVNLARAPHGFGALKAVRVAVITESFLPQINGVTNSVLRSCEQLEARGHDLLVVAPGDGPDQCGAATVVRAPSVRVPRYPEFQLGRPWAGLEQTIRRFNPDIVHLASPAVLGAHAAFVARRLGLPIVAVYQTDLAGFVTRYGLPAAARPVWRWLRRIHGMASRNLAPSRAAMDDLRRNGVERVVCWPRGVDLERFHPQHRDAALRAELASDGRVLVGYVGRLAAEKQLHLLRGLSRDPDVQLVIIGDGPQRRQLEHQLPTARFVGLQQGSQLSTLVASLDVFVHPGAHETFCQAAQEALASGVPVVGPASGGLVDLVQPGTTGYLFEPGSALSLQDGVRRLAEDAAARHRMGVSARASVIGRSWQNIGAELIDHYHAVVHR